MKYAIALPLALLLATACDRAAPPEPTAATEQSPPETTTRPIPAVASQAAADAGSLPDPLSEESAQGAAEVARTYYALIEAGKYDEAWRLRWESDTAPPADAERFAAGFSAFREYHATVGTPSDIAGAAGSLYVDVPVQVYGLRKDGRPFGAAGTVTLRRANDVPGSTAAQRRWRIYTR